MQVLSSIWTSPKFWNVLHCVGKCSESLINLLNVLNILNIIKILGLLNLLKVPSILDVLNILTSKREYNKRINMGKVQQLSNESCEEHKLFSDPKACEEKKLPTMFNFKQYLAGKSPLIVLDLTKNTGSPQLVLIVKGSRISQKVRSGKVGRPVKVIKVTKTKNIRKFTKVSKVISSSKSTKLMKMRKVTKLTEQTKLTRNKF